MNTLDDGGGEVSMAEIDRKLDDINDSVTVVSSVAEGLKLVGATVAELMVNLERALAAQQEAESARRRDAQQSKQRFWFTIGGVVLANIIVIFVAIFVVLGQQYEQEQAVARSIVNRDRQQCSTTLMVEWDRRLGDALRVSTQSPPIDQQSPEFRGAIDNLNEATRLLNQVEDLCYGPNPNPNPVRDR